MRPLALALLLTTAACTVGPDFKRPAAPDVTGYAPDGLPARTASADAVAGAAQYFDMGKDIPAQWWTLFRSQPLNDLVVQSLKANPTVDAARAALRQAQENERAQVGGYFPQISAGLSGSRNLTPTRTVAPFSSSGNPYYSLITPELNVSFVPDVFGANARAVESLAAQAENQRFELEATYLTLSSNVVAAAIQEASLRGQVAATQQTIAIETNLLNILRRQMALGQVAGVEVATQEAALAQARQALPPLQKQLAQQRDLLAVLAGRYPSEDVAARFEIASLHLPQEIPVSLPAKLVVQRPDVRAAEATLHATSAQIGVAVAARLPQLTLTAQLGNQAESISSLFLPGTNFWTLGAGLTTPLFEGGTLLHRQRAAQAAFDQAAAQYRNTVLTAMQNVADTLHALQSDADALVAAVETRRATARTLAITRKQLALGQVAYLTLLNAQQTDQQARLAVVQAQASRLADTAALFQALGGGWWNRPGVADAGANQP